jgi:hypothetical protein
MLLSDEKLVELIRSMAVKVPGAMIRFRRHGTRVIDLPNWFD